MTVWVTVNECDENGNILGSQGLADELEAARVKTKEKVEEIVGRGHIASVSVTPQSALIRVWLDLKEEECEE